MGYSSASGNAVLGRYLSITCSRTGVMSTSFLVPNAFERDLVINFSLLRLFSSLTAFCSSSSKTLCIRASSVMTASSASCSLCFLSATCLSSARLNEPKVIAFLLALCSGFSGEVTSSVIFFMIHH